MSCLEDDELAAYVAGSADADTVARIHEHIDQCAECRKLFAAAAAPSAVLTRREGPPVAKPAPRRRTVPIVAACSLLVLIAAAWVTAHHRTPVEAQVSPVVSGSVSPPPAPSIAPSATAIASEAPSSTPSAAPLHARCACIVDSWRLCKPELLETQCECHDSFGSLLFPKSEDVSHSTNALRTVAKTADGARCTGFAAVQRNGETTPHAEQGTGTLHPCSRACANATAFTGQDGASCSGMDEYGRPRIGMLRCQ